MYQKYPVELTEVERYQLKQILSSGTTSVRKVRRAQILLKSDSSPEGPNWSYQAICEAFNVSQPTITAVRRAYGEGGLEVAINRKKSERVYERRLDGEAEAHLIALACGEPPEGYERWTLRLLKARMIKLAYVENISHETIRTTLKKMNLSLG
jgi:DNA-binding transcriptional ArsR family regulator